MIICEIIVHLLVLVQNNKKCAVYVLLLILLLLLLLIGLEQVHTKQKSNTGLNAGKYLCNDADF